MTERESRSAPVNLADSLAGGGCLPTTLAQFLRPASLSSFGTYYPYDIRNLPVPSRRNGGDDPTVGRSDRADIPKILQRGDLPKSHGHRVRARAKKQCGIGITLKTGPPGKEGRITEVKRRRSLLP